MNIANGKATPKCFSISYTKANKKRCVFKSDLKASELWAAQMYKGLPGLGKLLVWSWVSPPVIVL